MGEQIREILGEGIKSKKSASFSKSKYSVKLEETREIDSVRVAKIQLYLKAEAQLPTLTENELKSCGTPITQEEVEVAIKDIVIGKSPGPDGYSAGYYK